MDGRTGVDRTPCSFGWIDRPTDAQPHHPKNNQHQRHQQKQRRDGLVAAQEALLGHAAFGTARRRASHDPSPSATTTTGPKFLHRLAHPPTPPLLSAQLKALVEQELRLPVLRTVGEADGLLAWGVAAPGSPFRAVLSRDSDFLVYAGGRLLPFDLLDTATMTVRTYVGRYA